MIMKKNLLYAMALAAMVSCSSDEFVGDNGSAGSGVGNGESAIAFNSSATKITRATANTGNPEVMLDKQFKVLICRRCL